MTDTKITTTLAVYIGRSGASFVVCHGGLLHDWGTKTTPAIGRQQRLVVVIHQLIAHYAPDVLVLEKRGARRPASIWAAYQSIANYARTKRIQVFRYTRKDIQTTFQVTNKHSMNVIIALHFSHLRSRMPRVRRAWDSEPYRQGLFDAASLALAYFVHKQGFVL